MTRRRAIGAMSAGALLSLGLWPGRAQTGSPAAGGESFRFVVVNDTHYMSEECGGWLEKVTRSMESHGDAEFCLLAGDLTEHGGRGDLGAVREIFGAMALPAFVVIGNHDYDSETSRGHYERTFPRRLNYVFRHRDWQFVGLDTSEGTKWQNTRIQPATFQWVDEHLRFLDPERPTVLFTHFPLGQDVQYRPVNADALLERFLPFNLQAVYNGHFHGTTERRWGRALLTTNQCCALKRNNHDGSKAKGYFLCTAEEGRVRHEFVDMLQS